MTPRILDMGRLAKLGVRLLAPRSHWDKDGNLEVVNFWIWW